MSRFAIGLYLVLHGLAHTGLGMTAQDFPRGVASELPATLRVALATTLFLGSMPVFVAAGIGLWGIVGLRRIWFRLTSVAVIASSLLIALFGASVAEYVFGLVFDVLALAICGTFASRAARRLS